jgi:protein-tyrosine phosphatase
MPRRLSRIAIAALLWGTLFVPAQAAEPVKIAFVDTGNTGRSVTAEALAQAEIDKDHLAIAVISRALDQDPYAIKPEANARALLTERGIDVAAHRSTQLTENDVRHSDLILTMTAAHKEKLVAQFPDAKPKTFTLAEYATGGHKDVEDAFGKDLGFYRAMIAQVASYIGPALVKAASLQKRD